ncbi:MAG: acyltransferase [Alphaproteobacteria bacterium]|nr:acyltransferase [Alphaproteobacteria bacterium]
MRAETAKAPRPRLRGLDALRGVAASAVVFFHYTYSFPRVTGRAFDVGFVASAGHYGVDLFFIISGFVIFMTLEKSRRAYDFVGARVARIYPAYLASLLLTAAVVGLSSLPVLRPTLAQFLANVPMVPQVFGQEVVDGVYWTLAYEAGFYLFAATVIWCCGLERIERVCAVWLAATLLLRFEPFVLWHYPYLLHMIRLTTTGSFAMLFIIGIMLYRICRGQARPLTYLVLAAALAPTFAGPLTFVHPMSGWGYFLLIASCAALVWLAGSDRLPLKPLAPLIFLGDISYSLYLLHESIGWVLMNRLLALGVGPMTTLVVAIAFAVALAFAMNRLVERPGQRVVRALFARYRGRIIGDVWPITTEKPLAGD